MQNKITWYMYIFMILYLLALVLDKLYPTEMAALNLAYFIIIPVIMFGIACGLWILTSKTIELNKDYLLLLHTIESKGYSKNLPILKEYKNLRRNANIFTIITYFVIAIVIWLLWSDI